ncbi:hypothetical protein MLD38_032673 [Melastoma candidum]|uniref:Uncharacterized protein n=1 Tax=Melastoma candidum TaxID=119954 RepID=A0ACB9M4W5_9MYRT|nr:hypothetical protein MLD38_032673 [Melastoma candidum]
MTSVAARNLRDKLKSFYDSRWLVFVCAMWMQGFAGVGYLFGSYSPLLKKKLHYNQAQLALLGVAKDLGDAVGQPAGALCEILPVWGTLAVGVVNNFIGYFVIWLVAVGILPRLPLWVLCIFIFLGTNGETYYNTGALISCVHNFPRNRGPVVGILKGFAGLSGAIMTQIYVMLNYSNESSLILMIAVLPSLVVIAVMFFIRYVDGVRQARPADNISFLLLYTFCILLAAYILVILLMENLLNISHALGTLLAAILIVFIVLPIQIPIVLSFFSGSTSPPEESLLADSQEQSSQTADNPEQVTPSGVIFSDIEDEKSEGLDLLTESERKKRIARLQTELVHAAAEGAVMVRRKKGPRRGEDFTMLQALCKLDLWLMFFSLLLAAGSGLTVVDNLGQICQSLGYQQTGIYVSMISIWNFLGRFGGGYFSEVAVRQLGLPRMAAMAAIQLILAIGLFYGAMQWPGEIYVVTIMAGFGYGAHWSVVPATASELFGLKSFGAIYNFLTLANPAGSLIFSGVLASHIYDYYAKKQASIGASINDHNKSLTCSGSICFSLTFGILSGICLIASGLSVIVVLRTKRVYEQLYGNPRS